MAERINQSYLPTQDVVASLLALTATTPEAAQYFRDAFESTVGKYAQDPAIQSLLKTFDQYAKDVATQYADPEGIFEGKYVKKPSEYLLEKTLDAPPTSLTGHVAIVLDIVEEAGKVDRAYRTLEGEELSLEAYHYLDAIFLRWLIQEGITRKDERMYLHDQQGKEVALSFDQLQAKMNDPERGLASTVRKAQANHMQTYVIQDIHYEVRPTHRVGLNVDEDQIQPE